MRKIIFPLLLIPMLGAAQENETGNKVNPENKLIKTNDSIGQTNILSGDLGESQASKALGFQLSVDQDAFYRKKNFDRDYTMGMLATIIGHMRKERPFFNQDGDEKEANRFLASFGFSAFTPLSLEYDFVDKTDRPYSAIAFISYDEFYAFKSSESTDGKSSSGKTFKHGLLVGSMGKGISKSAQFIQTGIHSGQRALAEDPSEVRPDPKGWKFAIANNSSFPIVFNYSADFSLIYEHIFLPSTKFFQPFKITLKPSAGVAIGTLYDNFTMGVDYQLGFLGTDLQFGNTITKRGNSGLKKIKLGLSLIGDAFAQAWAHNATLNGILFQDNGDTYVIRHKDMEPITWYGSVGGLASIGNIKFGYSVYIRSKVIEVSAREQYFGRAFIKIDIN